MATSTPPVDTDAEAESADETDTAAMTLGFTDADVAALQAHLDANQAAGERMTPADCVLARRRARAGDTHPTIAAREDIPATCASTVGHHVRGDCDHSVTDREPPVVQRARRRAIPVAPGECAACRQAVRNADTKSVRAVLTVLGRAFSKAPETLRWHVLGYCDCETWTDPVSA